MIRDKTIMDLPVRPSGGGGEVIHDSYLTQLRVSNTVDGLKEFAKKWGVMFLVKYSNKESDLILTEEEEKIVTGTFDAAEALECIRSNTRKRGGGSCAHIKKMKKEAKENPEAKQSSCVGMNLMMPAPMLFVSLVAERFNVPTDTAWIQLSRAVNPDIGKEISMYVYGR